jgi:hypothetical protein
MSHSLLSTTENLIVAVAATFPASILGMVTRSLAVLIDRCNLPVATARRKLEALEVPARCFARHTIVTPVKIQGISQMKPPMVMTEKIVLKNRIEAISFSAT